MNCVSRKRSALPYQRPFLGKQTRNFTANKLIADGLLAVRVKLVGVGNLPAPRGCAVVIGLGLGFGSELGAAAVEGVSVKILGTADGRVRRDRVVDEDGVVGPVNVGVNTQAE